MLPAAAGTLFFCTGQYNKIIKRAFLLSKTMVWEQQRIEPIGRQNKNRVINTWAAVLVPPNLKIICYKLQYCAGRELLTLVPILYIHRSFFMIPFRDDLFSS